MSKSQRRGSKSNIKLRVSNIPEANLADVVSIDAIIAAAYDGISGPAGEKRDWGRERSLFYPGARLIPTAKPGANNDLAPSILDVDCFIARWEADFGENRVYGQ